MTLLLLTMLTGSAEAATLRVPQDFTTLSAAIDQANATAANDTIVVSPGEYTLTSTKVIEAAGGGLTIQGTVPPREIADGDIVDDVIITFDVLQDVGSLFANVLPVVTMFEVAAPSVGQSNLFRIENVVLRQAEFLCEDGLDNDGNALADGADPVCEYISDVLQDTAGESLAEILHYLSLRAVTVRPNANFEMLRTQVQGWSFAVDGAAVYADRATFVGIDDSFFVSNIGRYTVSLSSGAYGHGRGVVHLRGVTSATVTNTHFRKNQMAYGGSLYAIGAEVGGTLRRTNLTVTDSIFREGGAEDGGAIYAEASVLTAQRNLFVANSATFSYDGGIPLDAVWEGGDIYAEDTTTTLSNNVFVQSATLDYGSSLALRREDFVTAYTEPVVMNNTFVATGGEVEAGTVLLDGSGMDFRNNILTRDGGVGVFGTNIPSTFRPANAIQYNCFDGYVANDFFAGDLAKTVVNQSDNLFVDPEFVYYPDDANPALFASWQFSLRLSSPCIDAGDPSMTDVGGSRIDVGAFGGLGSGAVDADNDGWVDTYDCNDDDNTVFPGAYDDCDDVDNDCNGIVDDFEVKYFLDRDGDGFGYDDPTDSTDAPELCPGQQPTSPPINQFWVFDNTDCDDTERLRNPGQPEICDGLDNDCDNIPDNNITPRVFYRDNDGDGFGDPLEALSGRQTCPSDTSLSPFGTDCNDNDATRYPLITLEALTHAPLAGRDLEESEADRSTAFVADFIDQDCDGGDLCYIDRDDDGFGEEPIGGFVAYENDNDLNCNNGSAATSSQPDDCDDNDPQVNPGMIEQPADGIDSNCDGQELCYVDGDEDGFGSTLVQSVASESCGILGASDNNTDCNDADPNVNPSAAEVCDGIDNNCNGSIDEVLSTDAQTYYLDADGDGFGVVTTSILACSSDGGETPLGYAEQRSEGFDCDDQSTAVFPGNDEICDGIDNDCNGIVDGADAIDIQTWYIDIDGDGFGDPRISVQACEQPGGYVTSDRPCDADDSDATVTTGCQSNTCSSYAPAVFLLFGMGGLRRRREDAKRA